MLRAPAGAGGNPASVGGADAEVGDARMRAAAVAIRGEDHDPVAAGAKAPVVKQRLELYAIAAAVPVTSGAGDAGVGAAPEALLDFDVSLAVARQLVGNGAGRRRG